MAAQPEVTFVKTISGPEGLSTVVGALDDNMVYPALVWAHSLNRSCSRPIFFIIGYLRGSLSLAHKKSLEDNLSTLEISHRFIELDDDPLFISQGHISPTTFAKFVLADVVKGPNVWIDIDVVATHNWDSLFDLLDSIPEKSDLLVAKRYRGTDDPQGISLPKMEMLFNAGVLGWPKKERLAWRDALSHTELVDTQEQYLFNKLYCGKVHYVSESFNLLSYHYDSLTHHTIPYLAHFAGAHKPWHLPRRFSKICSVHQCPWALWFEAEDSMLVEASRKGIIQNLMILQEVALHSGQSSSSADHRGRQFLRLLSRLGRAGWLLIILLRPFRSLIPRGTHPVH